MNSIVTRRIVNRSAMPVRAYSSSNSVMQDWANRPGVWD
eukprot:CAMPEP_0182417420 /NCGR_PEP_ID=MMETSP1167-20130531/1899_1 /TAXON_ID=2988 /ORGANISM="Mallomonas Sp, Strain CCMP3275" /LENGTH=38 /DNA_ID= /DNA_START= /DNA_END= /DNA_ORIENTATION=